MYFIYKVLFNILNLLNLKSHPMNMLMKIINHILSMIRNISFSYAKRIIVTLKLDVRKRYCNIINIRV